MEERHEPQPGDASSLPHPERNVQVSNALQLLQPGAVDALTSPAACLRVLRQGVMGTLLERARGEGHAVQHRVACARALEQLVCLTSSVFGALRCDDTLERSANPGVAVLHIHTSPATEAGGRAWKIGYGKRLNPLLSLSLCPSLPPSTRLSMFRAWLQTLLQVCVVWLVGACCL